MYKYIRCIFIAHYAASQLLYDSTLLVVVRSTQLNVICHDRSTQSEENYKVRETFLIPKIETI